MTVYVYDPTTDKMVPKGTEQGMRACDGVQIMSDIQPYKSMADGTIISSRSHHRAHLRRHNCIEVGNEKMESAPRPTAIKSDNRRRMLHQLTENMTDRQANKVLAELKERYLR